MMRIYYLLALLFLFISCTREDSDHEKGKEGILPPLSMVEEHEPGWVRIKFTGLTRDLQTGATRSGALETGVPELNQVAASLGATKVERVFAEGGKYRERRRAAGLHLWYDFYVGEDILTRAMRDFSLLDCVDVVELIPVFRQNLSQNSAMLEYTYNLVSASRNAVESQTRALPSTAFNDPLLKRQWHYQNDGTNDDKARVGADINLFAAWEITTGHPDVIVAVMDGGIDYTHPDLAQNMWINTAEKDGVTGDDDDRNGYVDDVYGYRWGSSSTPPGGGDIKPMDHGTHCAGTIAAVNNNGVGLAGVAGGNGAKNSGVRLMSCQTYVPDPAFPEDPYGNSKSTSQSVDAFAYAADNGAVIVNCSFSYSGTTLSAAYKAGIDYFVDNAGQYPGSPLKGGLVVGAAGNDGQEISKYPGAYERCISVAYMTSDYVKSSSSNYGPWVNITAPGGATGSSYAPNKVGGVFSTAPMASGNYDVQQGYAYKSGTSMAAPHVAGVAALIVSAMREKGVTDYTLTELWKALLMGTRDINQYNSTYKDKLGVGYLDARLALDYALGNGPAVESVITEESTEIITFRWQVPVGFQGGVPDSFIVLFGESPFKGTDYENPSQGVDRQVIQNDKLSGQLLTLNYPGLKPGTPYYIGVVAVYESGGISSFPKEITVSTKSPAGGGTPFSLTPSVVKNYLYIHTDVTLSSVVNLKIFNATGNKVLDKEIAVTPVLSGAVDLSKLTAGVYTVVVSQGGYEFKQNIIKQ